MIPESVGMICPVCSKEFVSGLAECPECHIPLVEEEELANVEDQIRYMLSHWELVYTTNTMLDAEMLQANLESAGITTRILSQIDTARQLTVGGLAIVKVFVKSVDKEDALAIIRDIENNRESEA